MSGLTVPQLTRKLRMLVDYGPYPNLEAVAKALGRSPVTLRGWANGGSGEPERLPRGMVDAVLALYAGALPGLSPEQVRQVVCGPADDLEQLFAAQAASSILDLIAREADRTSGNVHIDEGGLALIRTGGRNRKPAEHIVGLGRAFRIEFATSSRAGFVVAFQSAPGGWGMVPCAFGRAAGQLYLPGLDESAAPEWMVEDNEIGRHLFIAAQASRPFPAELSAAAHDHLTLDRTLLGYFVRHFEAQQKSSRRLFALEMEIVRNASSPG